MFLFPRGGQKSAYRAPHFVEVDGTAGGAWRKSLMPTVVHPRPMVTLPRGVGGMSRSQQFVVLAGCDPGVGVPGSCRRPSSSSLSSFCFLQPQGTLIDRKSWLFRRFTYILPP